MSLIELVIEWRDARQAVFDSQPDDDRPKLFEHLSLCEHALMDFARRISRSPQVTETPHE